MIDYSDDDLSEDIIPWGPTGQVVYDRTYSRTKPGGEKEQWHETVCRVARGNLELVYGPQGAWAENVWQEYCELAHRMERFQIIPAGRHLWASGVKGRQYLFNCHVSGWSTPKLSGHFEFTFMRLMEGGGVGANYSSRYLERFGSPQRALKVHVVCDPSHPDYLDMVEAGLISTDFSVEWEGAFPVEDSREGWSAAMVDLIDTFMTEADVQHKDRVYDVSRVRGKGQPLRTFGGTASGPLPFARMMHEIGRVLSRHHEGDNPLERLRHERKMRGSLTPIEAMEIDHAIAECVVSGGVRRSARMAQVHWLDPDVFHFINCKKDSGKHWTTNISVEIDSDFIEALKQDDHDWHDLAWDVHRASVAGMLTNGEPGYWNSSLSNLGEVNEVVATNPCLTGDTVIATVNGPRTFADLAEAGEDVLVYSWHPRTKRPVVRWMRRPHRTAENAEILKVTFDSGLVVRCTPNHGFYSFRGEKVEARDLREGQSIRAFSASRDSSGHERVHGWDSRRNAADHQWTHRMLWEATVGPIPDGYVIAHLDNDGANNDLDNLALMTDLGHRRHDMSMRQLAGFDGHSPNHKVISVEPGGYADVYNGMVEDSHSYIVLDPTPIAGHMSGIVSANCGEIALPDWGACVLGHVNLDAFAPAGKYDLPNVSGLIRAHELMTRFLVRATFGDMNDPKQKAVMDSERRIGVGHLGVQGYLAKRGVRYSDAPTNWGFIGDLDTFRDVCRQTARQYAFELRIPEPVKVTTVAPTGSVAKLPGVSEGCHAIYSRYFLRRVRFNANDPGNILMMQDAWNKGFALDVDQYDPTGNTWVVTYPTKDRLVDQVEALGYGAEIVESQDELTLEQLLAFQAMYQDHYADNAVSFTVNIPAQEHQAEAMAKGEFEIPAPTTSYVDVVAESLLKYLPKLKGTTIMVDGSRPQAPYERITEAEYEAAEAKRVEDGTDEDCASGACPVR